MLNPSYSSLIKVINEDNSLDNKITSRYSIVIAAAKRARQIVAGAHYDSGGVATDKAVSIAVSEMERRKLRIVPMEDSFEPIVTAPIMPTLMDSFSVPADDMDAPDYNDDDAEFEGTADEAAAYGDLDDIDNDDNYEDFDDEESDLAYDDDNDDDYN